MRTDICHDFARAIAETQYERLSPAAIDAAKKSVLDTLGVTLAASGLEPAVRGFIEVTEECAGKPESSVLGFGGRAPAPLAAFANGSMAHCLDFDDQTPWGAHSASSIIPAVFALAERKGGVSGKQLIAAVAAGQDLFVRLRCNVGWAQDWNLSTMAGVFSAAASASKILGLSTEKVAHALGIASMQSSGTMELIFGRGSDLRGMYAGFTAQGAVLGALLADKGITGIDTLFEGKAGIFKTYFGGKYDRDAMLKDLGKDYLGATTLYKAWPAVGNVHTYLHATLSLMREHGLAAEDIEQIRVWIGDFGGQMSYPLEQRRAPATLVDAKFSLPFCVAIVAELGHMKASDFTPALLENPRVLAMAQKIVPVDDSSYDWKMKLPDARVEILTRDGRRLERFGDKVPGSAEAPMSWDDLIAKFTDCASVAATRISTDRIAKAHETARRLEDLDDAVDLIRLLS
jgi:2-methylcitrate dehydratase PrpD